MNAAQRDERPVWEGGEWEALAPLTGKEQADVCVVGLGSTGLTAALELAELGRSVIGVDAGAVAGAASGRNGGLLLAGLAAFHHNAVESIGGELATRLYRLTEQERERALKAGYGGARRTGSLRIAADERELEDCERQLYRMRADGLTAETYAGPLGEGLFFPLDGAFNPLLRSRQLARSALAAGVRLFESSPVTEVAPGRVVTGAGSVECQTVIVAVDGKLESLLPELVGEVRTARLQMLATEPTDEIDLPAPVYRRFGYEYYQKTADGRVALGGFRDAGEESEWTHDTSPSVKVQGRIEAYLREVLGVAAPITHRWAASVGFRPGLLPLARELREGLYAVGGYNGTGNLVGTLLGRAVARVAAGQVDEVWEAFGGN